MNSLDPKEPAAVKERRRLATEERVKLLDPNRDSDVKVVGPWLSLPSVKVALRVPSKFMVEGYAPSKAFRVAKFRSNAPCPGVFYISSLMVANVLSTVGVPWKDHPHEGFDEDDIEGMIAKGQPTVAVSLDEAADPTDRGCYHDAYGECDLELPTLGPHTRVTAKGFYSGFVPLGYGPGFEFTFTMTLIGKGSLV
jgi:hypothetical protein